MTGHWPVVNESDLAQPVPSDSDSEPILAASSMPPGSPVTYRPGMPIAPPAAVTSISEFSTVAGASCASALPCPRASKPTASTAASTSGTPRICSSWSLGSPSATLTVSQPNWLGPGHVHRGTRLDPGRHRAVEAGREDVRQHGQVLDLGQGLVLVGELEQVPVGVGHHHVLGLAADPAAHVHVAVGRARPVRVDVEADAGLAFLAVLAPPAGDVERHAGQGADLDELDVPPGLDDLAEDLVPEDQPGRRGGAAADHVLVTAADVGRDDLEDHAVLALAADVGRVDPGTVLQLQLGVGDVLYFDLARLEVGNGSVSGHRSAFLCWGRTLSTKTWSGGSATRV